MTHQSYLTGGHGVDLGQEDRTEQGHLKALVGIIPQGPADLVPAPLLGRKVDPGHPLVTQKDALVVAIPEVDRETVHGPQEGRGSPVGLVHGVAPGIEMEGSLAVVHGLVISTLEDPAQTVVIG